MFSFAYVCMCVLANRNGQDECSSEKASGLPIQCQLTYWTQILKFTLFFFFFLSHWLVFTEKGIKTSPWPMRMMHDNSLGIFLLFKSQI